MAWTDPNTYIAGAILTAAQMNAMQANALAGGPIYATEAARTTAISSPFEGQRAYITGSTVAAATGADTAVPTGIQTIYNGSGWVCVTPVASRTDASGTVTSTSFTATLSGTPGTNPSVTLTTGTTAIVSVACELFNSVGGSGSIASVAVSGATTLAAIDANGASNAITTAIGTTKTFVITGLTAGNNVFTLQYRVGGNTGTFRYRAITVQGIA